MSSRTRKAIIAEQRRNAEKTRELGKIRRNREEEFHRLIRPFRDLQERKARELMRLMGRRPLP